MELERQLTTAGAQIQLMNYQFPEPPEGVLRGEGGFRLELCLTSRHRSARARFRDAWSGNRYEPLGSFFLVPPGMEILARSDENRPLSTIVCQLDRELVLELFDTSPDLTDQVLLATLDIRAPKLGTLLLRLAEEVKEPGLASHFLVDLMVQQIAVELVRHGVQVRASDRPGGLAPWQLRQIDERLCEVREAPTLLALADLCRISVRQLARGFRASRGCSIGAYVTASQMEHAQQLLMADNSVASIATALGFASSSSFCFAFRRATGLTPGQFRETLLRH